MWSAVLFGIMSMYMAFFSTMQEMAQVKFEMLPKEYLQLMGVEDISQMGNYVTFFGMIFNILIIIMSIYAVIFSMNLILKEEKNKTIEYLYALSVTRKEIYLSKVLVALCAVFFVVLSVGIAGIIFGFASGSDTFSMVDMSAVIKITGTVPFFFAALGLFLSSLTSKYVSSGLGAGIVMLTYMLGYLGKILEGKADFLKYFSPFELLSPTNALALSGETYGAFGVIAALTVILLILASIMYKRRDFSL
ncbi:MAG: ABC transporter permease subunit [Candidatus Treponema excrementipullorum]|nr:ABC transporter permease subunit [Candidatus Treponema excrementipullorum]